MPSSDYAPALADIGALLRARTKDAGDNELGTFTTGTRPTAAEVQALIDSTLPVVAVRIGADIDEAFRPAAKRLVALKVAAHIERSYRPETTNSDGSAYKALVDEYDETLDTLIDAGIKPAFQGYRCQVVPIGTVEESA